LRLAMGHSSCAYHASGMSTKPGESQWTDPGEVQAGFYAEWLLLRAMKAEKAPYHLEDLPIAPDMHWLAYARDQVVPAAPAASGAAP